VSFCSKKILHFLKLFYTYFEDIYIYLQNKCKKVLKSVKYNSLIAGMLPQHQKRNAEN